MSSWCWRASILVGGVDPLICFRWLDKNWKIFPQMVVYWWFEMVVSHQVFSPFFSNKSSRTRTSQTSPWKYVRPWNDGFQPHFFVVRQAEAKGPRDPPCQPPSGHLNSRLIPLMVQKSGINSPVEGKVRLSPQDGPLPVINGVITPINGLIIR